MASLFGDSLYAKSKAAHTHSPSPFSGFGNSATTTSSSPFSSLFTPSPANSHTNSPGDLEPAQPAVVSAGASKPAWSFVVATVASEPPPPFSSLSSNSKAQEPATSHPSVDPAKMMTPQDTPLSSFDPTTSMRSKPSLLEQSRSGNPFVFRTGTIKLLATYNKQPMIGSVSADALVLASPVWEKFLIPPWENESALENEVKEKQIDCSEDNGAALLVLLNIAHLNFDDVPATLDYATLLQVAVLVDQYNCIKTVRPWLESWMKNEAIECLKTRQEGWLFISWVFGRDNSFESLARHMVIHSRASSNRGLFGARDGKWTQHLLQIGCLFPIPEPVPAGIIESIIVCRNEILEALLDVAYRRLSSLEGAMRSSSTSCTMSSQNKVCDAAIYGSLMFGLSGGSVVLYPRKTAENLTDSVKSISDLLSRITFHHIKSEAPKVTPAPPVQNPSFSFGQPPARPSLFGGQPVLQPARGPTLFGGLAVPAASSPVSLSNKDEDHALCAIGFSASVTAILARVRCPVLDSHRIHMKVQRGAAAPGS